MQIGSEGSRGSRGTLGGEWLEIKGGEGREKEARCLDRLGYSINAINRTDRAWRLN